MLLACVREASAHEGERLWPPRDRFYAYCECGAFTDREIPIVLLEPGSGPAGAGAGVLHL